MLLYLAGGSQRDRPPVVHGEDPIGDRADQAHVVLDHEHGDAQDRSDVLDPERHVLRLLDAEPRGRFVQEQETRPRAERACHLDDLADAVGEVDDEAVAVRLQIEEVDHLLDRLSMLELEGAHAGQEQELVHEA